MSRVRPYRTRLRDATRRAERAAEAAGQRTAARRLLRRVSQLVALAGDQPRDLIALKNKPSGSERNVQAHFRVMCARRHPNSRDD